MLFYGRHFGLLALLLAALAAAATLADAGTVTAPPGMVTAFGLYAALYSTLIVTTAKIGARGWRPLACIVLGTVLCMVNVAASRSAAHGVLAWLGPAGPAVLLAVASALGAVGFALSLRWSLQLPLPGRAVAPLAALCALSSWAVFRSGLYLRAPGAWFAASWWLTFSAGLWITDALRWTRSGTSPVRSDL